MGFPSASAVTVGEYNIEYSATDQSENEAYCDFTVNVIGKH